MSLSRVTRRGSTSHAQAAAQVADNESVEMADEETKRMPALAAGNEVGYSQVSAASLREEIEAAEANDREQILERVEQRRQLAKMLVNNPEQTGSAEKSGRASSEGRGRPSSRGGRQSAAAAGAAAPMAELKGREKLDFLLKQTELFTQFILMQNRGLKPTGKEAKKL